MRHVTAADPIGTPVVVVHDGGILLHSRLKARVEERDSRTIAWLEGRPGFFLADRVYVDEAEVERRRAEEAGKDRRKAWEHLDRVRAALAAAGAPGGDDLSLEERVTELTRERDEWHDQAIGLAEDTGRLRSEIARLRGALEKAKGPIAIAASYADAPEVSVGLRVHARDCARILPEINAALAGEACGDGGPCQRCDGSGYEVDLYPDGSADREPCGACNTPEKAIGDGEAKACGKRSVGGDICTRQAGHDGLHHCVDVVEGMGPMDVQWGVEAPEKARQP